jgi:hypothetical protein
MDRTAVPKTIISKLIFNYIFSTAFKNKAKNERIGVAVSVETCTREVLGSNLARIQAILTGDLPVFPQFSMSLPA